MLNLRLAVLNEVVKLDYGVLPADSGLLQARPDALNMVIIAVVAWE